VVERHLAIVNPAAGGGRCGRRAAGALDNLRRQGLQVEVAETGGPGDGVRLAREAVLAGHRSLIAVGGDGTLFEVVNGLMAAMGDATAAERGARPCLGVLPLGSGNSFVRDFGDGSPESAVRALARGERRPCDVIRIGHDRGVTHFVNIFSIGFVAEVGALRTRRFSGLGALGYVLAVVVEVARLRQWDFPLALDGQPLRRGRATFVAVCNSRFTGGAMEMAPGADTVDGRLDVVEVGALGRLSLLATFPRIFKGTHVTHPAVRAAQARTVRFELEGELPVLVDGEILRLRPHSLEVLPGAIDIRA
jgi:YegS/Rv2252/BmrU family lipid kinase